MIDVPWPLSRLPWPLWHAPDPTDGTQRVFEVIASLFIYSLIAVSASGGLMVLVSACLRPARTSRTGSGPARRPDVPRSPDGADPTPRPEA